jgi:DNA-binding CsgD family transcriptional regulator
MTDRSDSPSLDRTSLSEFDVRAMVRLLGETIALPGGHGEKKRFLMDGLCELIGADSWVWTLGCQLKPGEAQVYVAFMHGGFDDQGYANLLQALEHPKMGPAFEAFYTAIANHEQHTTMVREEVDPKGLAYQPGPRELWKKADIGPVMLSDYPLDANSLSAIAIYRKFGAEPFSSREKQIAHLILEEVPWLHLSGWPEDRSAKVPQLSPRQRMVLNLLLDGLGRKQIAASLEISENTVAGYCKEVYRCFSVNSQAELMHKFLAAKT